MHVQVSQHMNYIAGPHERAPIILFASGFKGRSQPAGAAWPTEAAWSQLKLWCCADVGMTLNIRNNLLTGTIPQELRFLPLAVSTGPQSRTRS